jgi:hypothetical protein
MESRPSGRTAGGMRSVKPGSLSWAASRLKPPEPSLRGVPAVGRVLRRFHCSAWELGASGPAGQKPEEIVAGQHTHGNSVLDHGYVMQIPLHHAVYNSR